MSPAPGGAENTEQNKMHFTLRVLAVIKLDAKPCVLFFFANL